MQVLSTREAGMIENLRQLLIRPAYRPGENVYRGDFFGRFTRWRQKRKEIELLLSMPDYLLKDIGISRGEILLHRRLPMRS
ncbi:DUF1127 domain-containing protein [Sinorhizobium sp. 6-70]|uniref:DUF1127 domain-containing protein n=1 Tax=Sinorhizobium sp. 6-70 TaxID=3049088 RepID=UPI0034DE8066